MRPAAQSPLPGSGDCWQASLRLFTPLQALQRPQTRPARGLNARLEGQFVLIIDTFSQQHTPAAADGASLVRNVETVREDQLTDVGYHLRVTRVQRQPPCAWVLHQTPQDGYEAESAIHSFVTVMMHPSICRRRGSTIAARVGRGGTSPRLSCMK